MKFLQYILFLIVTGLLLPCAVIAEDSYVPDTVYMLHYFAKDYVSSYLYSADGERVWKFAGTATMTYSNGQLVNSDLEMDKTFYPTPQTTFDKQKFYKHYYIGSERISTTNGQFTMTAANTPSPVEPIQGNTSTFIAGFNSLIAHALDSVGYSGYITIDTVFSCIVQQSGSTAKGIGPIHPPIVICATQYYYHYNHQGSVALLTDKCGNLAQQLQYLPYGGIFVDHRTGSYSSPYTFSAKEKDTESGYNYFGARYYTDNIMMWLSVDPMSDERPNVSPYSYCQNNPIGRVDTWGALDDWYENTQTGELKWINSQKTTITDNDGSWNNVGTELLTFNGNELTYYTQKKSNNGNLILQKHSFPAVSGRSDENGAFDYSRTSQAIPNIGPIPEGDYSINPQKIQSFDNISLLDKIISTTGLGGSFKGGKIAWGNDRVWIEPSKVEVRNPKNGNTIIRTNFSIHGGVTPGSAGCIDLHKNADNFFNVLKTSESNKIKLRVNY